MTHSQQTMWIIGISGFIFVAVGVLLVAIFVAALLLSTPEKRTRLGLWLRHFTFSLGAALVMTGAFFIGRALHDDGETLIIFYPPWLDLLLRVVLMIFLLWSLLAAFVSGPLLAVWVMGEMGRRRRDLAIANQYDEARQVSQDQRQIAQDIRQTAQDTRQTTQDVRDRAGGMTQD